VQQIRTNPERNIMNESTAPAEEPKWLIYSVRNTSGEQFIWWWGPDSKGYTPSITTAGRYSEQEAKEVERCSHGENIAIPESVALSCYQHTCIDPGWGNNGKILAPYLKTPLA
jgi:hypothetical protein